MGVFPAVRACQPSPSEVLGTDVPVPATIGYLLRNVTGFVADLHSRP
ncbi:hypothetical protein [Amycolatopsis sp. YIM 10]|nr:hypothetical protein [Amycolatopsis sp. YIM 10]